MTRNRAKNHKKEDKMAKAPKKEDGVAVSGNVMFYKNPQPLAKDQHGKFGVKQVSKPFEFMQEQHFVPITAPEFGAAAASFPVIFAGDEKTPLAVSHSPLVLPPYIFGVLHFICSFQTHKRRISDL